MRTEKAIYLLLCGLVFSYILLRCIQVPLVHDEVATYVHYVIPQEFIPGQSHVDANNHILNSALSILNTELFGVSPLSLRLANLLAFIVLAFYLFRLSRQFSSTLYQWTFILAILGSHYMMEFHALSRGYGLSMAFLLGMLFHLQEYSRGRRHVDQALTVLFIFLALASNLSLLFPAIMAMLIMIFISFRTESKMTWPIVLLGVTVLALFIRISFWLKNSGALYYGQGGGFWKISMKTLSLYLAGEAVVWPILFVLMALLCLILLARNIPMILRTFEFKGEEFHIILFGSLAAIFLSHTLMDTNYPEDRVGLYLYPLLIGAFIISLDSLSLSTPSIRWVSIILLYFPAHFLLNMNLSHVDHWFRERIPDKFYTELESYYEEKEVLPMVSGYHTTSLTYFMKAHLESRKVPDLVYQSFPNTEADYIITRVNEDSLAFPEFTIVEVDAPSGNKLWKRNGTAMRRVVNQKNEEISLFDKEFFDLIRVPVNGKGHYGIELKVNYRTTGEPVKLEAVLNIRASDESTVAYVPYALHWRQHGNNVNAHTTLFAAGNGEIENELLLYLWNREKREIHDLTYEVSLFETLDRGAP